MLFFKLDGIPEPPEGYVPPLGSSRNTWTNIYKNKGRIDYCVQQFGVSQNCYFFCFTSQKRCFRGQDRPGCCEAGKSGTAVAVRSMVSAGLRWQQGQHYHWIIFRGSLPSQPGQTHSCNTMRGNGTCRLGWAGLDIYPASAEPCISYR
jgi:hypothetical protein